MAYYNHMEASRRKEAEEKFKELKTFITSMDESQKLNEFYLASLHIEQMEREIKEQAEQLAEYRKFFSLMRQLLPKQFSIHDKIY